MSRFNPSDLVIELADLAGEMISDVRQQLLYYRASVYKDETARQVREQLENLRVIAELIADDSLLEAFHDHDEMLARGAAEYIPGECSFSKRVGRLMTDLNTHFGTLISRQKNQTANQGEGQQLRDRLKEFRGDIVSMCRHGSRHWSFFQSFK